MKVCSKCGEKRAISNFGRNVRMIDGIQKICKPCRRSKITIVAKDKSVDISMMMLRWARNSVRGAP